MVFVVSGGQGDDEVRSEAEAMADYLRGRGVPADRIVREDRSVNTGQNLRYSVALMDRTTPGHRATVVTSGFHVYRTTLLARRVGAPVHVVGAPTSPPTGWPRHCANSPPSCGWTASPWSDSAYCCQCRWPRRSSSTEAPADDLVRGP